MDWESVDERLIKRGELLLSLEFLERALASSSQKEMAISGMLLKLNRRRWRSQPVTSKMPSSSLIITLKVPGSVTNLPSS